MEVVLNEENTIQQVFWQGNHKTSIKPGGGGRFGEKHAKGWKYKNILNTSDCSKRREKGASEEQSRKDISSEMCFENERERRVASFSGSDMPDSGLDIRNPVYEEQQGVSHLRDDSWHRVSRRRKSGGFAVTPFWVKSHDYWSCLEDEIWTQMLLQAGDWNPWRVFSAGLWTGHLEIRGKTVVSVSWVPPASHLLHVSNPICHPGTQSHPLGLNLPPNGAVRREGEEKQHEVGEELAVVRARL